MAELVRRQRLAGHEVVVTTRTPGDLPRFRRHAAFPVAGADGQTDPRPRVDLVPVGDSRAAEAARAGVPALATVAINGAAWNSQASARSPHAGGWAAPGIQWAAVSGSAAEPVRRALRPAAASRVVPNAPWTRPHGPPGRLGDAIPTQAGRGGHAADGPPRRRPLALVEPPGRHRRPAAPRRPPALGPHRRRTLDRPRATRRRRGLSTWIAGVARTMTRCAPGSRRRRYTSLRPTSETFGLAALGPSVPGWSSSESGTGVADLVETGSQDCWPTTTTAITDHVVTMASDPLPGSHAPARTDLGPGFDWPAGAGAPRLGVRRLGGPCSVVPRRCPPWAGDRVTTLVALRAPRRRRRC